MLCKCGFENDKESKFCSSCGILLKRKVTEIPKMLTIKEAHEIIFMKKISLSKLYDLVRTKNIPHVNVNGKILIDLEKTIEWWNKKLEESVKPDKLSGLRKII